MKSSASVERLRTQEASAVYQETYARLLMLTLSSRAGQLAQPYFEQRKVDCRYRYKINGLALLRKWRNRFFVLWSRAHDQTPFDARIDWIAEDANPVRPGRSYRRKSKFVSPMPAHGA